MRRVTQLSAIAVVLAVAGGGTMAAYAQWTIPSKASGFRVKSVDMPKGVRPSVAKNGIDAVISWSPQEIDPGTAMQAYIVRRHNADTDALSAEFEPTAALTLTDKSVAAGKWYWTVAPKFARWTGVESKASEKLKFTAPPAGAPANTLVSVPATVADPAAKAAPQSATVAEVPAAPAEPVATPAAPSPSPTQTTSAPATPAPAETTPSSHPSPSGSVSSAS